MARRIVDLSVPLNNTAIADLPGSMPKIVYTAHAEGAAQMLAGFPGLKRVQLPDGQGWAVEQVSLITHSGTHVDAPWHYHPTMNDGEPAWTIDEVPLDWCFQPGVKLDFRHFPDGYVVGAADIEAELKRIGHELKPLEIVVVNTSAGGHYGEPDYLSRGCGMGAISRAWACESSAPTAGAGTLPSSTPPGAGWKPTIPRSSGRATRPDVIVVIAKSRNSPISTPCPPTAS